MSNSTAVDQPNKNSQQQKRVLRARRGRAATRSGSLTADARSTKAADTTGPIDAKDMADQQQPEQQDKQHGTTTPNVETSRPAKRQRKQQQQGLQEQQPQPQPQHMSAFEAERAARIASNMARLAALELPQIAAGLADLVAPATKAKAAAPSSQKGVSGKRRHSSEQQQQPLRRSARNQGAAPDAATAAGIEHENKDGTVVLAGSTAGLGSAAAAVAAAAPPGPLPFKSSNGDESSDGAFLALLAAQAAAAVADKADSSNSSSEGGSSSPATGAELSRLNLSAADVAKMTRDGVSCLAFHPSSSRLILAAADKSGKVSLWDIDAQQEGSSGYDGVLMFEPHRDYVSSLKWANPHTLVSGSYDGTVRTLDVNTGVWGLLAGVPDTEDDWSAGELSAGGAVVYLATSQGCLSIVDSRSSLGSNNSSSSLVIANRKVNTLHLHTNQLHLAAAASDGTVSIWDVRNLAAAATVSGSSSSSSSSKAHKPGKPVCSVCHSKSSQGAYWAPDGSGRLLSISFDDTLKLWQDPAGAAGSSGKLQQMVSIRHNNNTGRWVVPFRPAWSPGAESVLVGDMKRGVAVFDATTGAQQCLMAAEPLTAIPSRLALHPGGLPVLAAATSSGRVHIWR